MEPRTLDLAAYPRRAHFDYFRQMANPYVSVTAPCDITALRRLTQERGLPFFLTVLHCAINAANAVPELRAAARIVAPDCAEDGVAQVIERVLEGAIA